MDRDVGKAIASLMGAEERGEKAIAAAAKLLDLTETQVRTTIRCYGAYAEEIDERIRHNVEEADAVEVFWCREQPALA